MKIWYRNAIYCINSCKCCFPLETSKTPAKDKKSADNIKDVSVFTLGTTILLRCTWTGILRNGSLFTNEFNKICLCIFHSIISTKNFDRARKLSLNHSGKIIIELRKLRTIFHEIYTGKTGVEVILNDFS